ncbi:histone H3.v1-like [Vespa mandarinia]|uniref:histone H3.v1-like n=1 Tax=Vespa mandarinia TaxID=7446 RepID=UPI00160BFEE3|nr:histone H3.v1-like [Vespa mandarinia]XP_035719136.1 histone H3.v1-like [Vespa mandarinia]XP_035719137.1 histone H3.v1-like [Vespa mandarinia]
MTICIVWLLAYVGQVLELENRPMSVAHGRHRQDCHHEVSIRKFQNGQSSIDGNLLHLKTHPYEGSHRDDLSEWLVYTEKRPIYSWTTRNMMVDGIIKEPKDLNTNLLALSPGLSNVLYPEYVSVTSPYVSVSSMSRTTTEPLVDDALLAQHQHRFQRQHKQQQQQQQRQHHHQQQQQQQQRQQQQRRQLHQRNKKRRIIDYSNNKQAENQAVELPILIYYNGEKILPDRRQSDQENVYEQRLNSPMKLKTEPIYERFSKPFLSSIFSSSLPSSSSSSSSSSASSSSSSSSFSSASTLSSSREFFNDEELTPSKPFIYEINDPSEKRNQIIIRRRSVNLPGESSVSRQTLMPPTSSFTSERSSLASHFIRTTRGSRHYDVPQIECPASEEGMERFACPTPDRMGRYRCIDDHVLCDGFTDCPQGEDENMLHCMFFKTTRAHLDVLADAILRWARGR